MRKNMKEKIIAFRVIRARRGKEKIKYKGFRSPIFASFDWLYWAEALTRSAIWDDRVYGERPIPDEEKGLSDKELYLLYERREILDIEEISLDAEEKVSFCHSGYHFEWRKETRKGFWMTAAEAYQKYLDGGMNPDHELIIEGRKK